jgi:hypothetical protein
MNHNPPLIPRVSPYAVWYYFWIVKYRADALIVMFARCASLSACRKN